MREGREDSIDLVSCSWKLKGMWDSATNVTGHQVFTSVHQSNRACIHQLVNYLLYFFNKFLRCNWSNKILLCHIVLEYVALFVFEGFTDKSCIRLFSSAMTWISVLYLLNNTGEKKLYTIVHMIIWSVNLFVHTKFFPSPEVINGFYAGCRYELSPYYQGEVRSSRAETVMKSFTNQTLTTQSHTHCTLFFFRLLESCCLLFQSLCWLGYCLSHQPKGPWIFSA